MPFGAATIALLVCLVFAPAVVGDFIFDDDTHLTENILLHRDGLRRVWLTTDEPNYWPITFTSYWVEWRLAGLNNKLFHLTNLILHAANSILVWQVLARYGVRHAWLAGVLFAVHPVNVETAAWIAQRKTLLSMLFFLLTLICYTQFEKSSRRGWYAASLGLFLTALLSKGAAVPLPCVLLLAAWWQRGRIAWRDVWRASPFFLAAVGMGLVEIWFQTYRAIGSDAEFIRSDSFLARLAGAGWAVWFYLYKAVLPWEVCFVYPRWRIDASNPIVYVPGLALCGLLLAAWRARESWGRPVFAALVYFVMMLGPMLGFINIYFMQYSLVADHYQYLALPPILALAACWGEHVLCWLMDRIAPRQHSAGAVLGTLIVAALAFVSWRQAHAYQNQETLYLDTIAKNPRCTLAYNNLARFYRQMGQRDRALAIARRWSEIEPDNPDAFDLLNMLFRDRGNFSAAEAAARQALQINPQHNPALVNLALTLEKLGDDAEAERLYRDVLTRDPLMWAAWIDLGNLLERQGHLPEALDCYWSAVRAAPERPETHHSLGLALVSRQQFPQAAEEFREALRLAPGFRDAQSHLDRLPH